MTDTALPTTRSASAPSTVPGGGLHHRDAAPVERGTRLRRRAAGTAIVAAGLLTAAGFATCPWENAPGEDAYLHSLLSNPPMAMLSMVLLHYGYLLFVPAVFVLARLARRGSPKLAAAGLVLGVLGSGLSGLLVTDAYDLSIAQHLPLAQALAVEDGISPGGMLAIALPTGFGTMIGLVLVAVALWRARWVSWLPAAVMLAGWVVGFGSHTAVRACTGAALITISLVLLGIRVLRMSDEEFASGTPA